MRPFILIGFVLAAFLQTTVYADPWTCTDTWITGSSPEEVSAILNNHASDFQTQFNEASSSALAGLPIDPITSVSIEQRTCRWNGPTVCKADDPRLTVSLEIPRGCHASGVCFTSSVLLGGDPCS